MPGTIPHFDNLNSRNWQTPPIVGRSWCPKSLTACSTKLVKQRTSHHVFGASNSVRTHFSCVTETSRNNLLLINNRLPNNAVGVHEQRI
jgi:hypothetical protein